MRDALGFRATGRKILKGLKGIQNVLATELDAAEKKGTAIEKVLYRMLCEEFAFRQQRIFLEITHRQAQDL